MHFFYYISEFGLRAQVGRATVLRSYTHRGERTVERLEQNTIWMFTRCDFIFIVTCRRKI